LENLIGYDMENEYWEYCPYYSEGKCPSSGPIDKAYLIPHVLSSSELDEAKRICRECGKYLHERRKYVRLKKHFDAFLIRTDRHTKFRGRIIDVSGVGALVAVDDLFDLSIGERIMTEVHSHQESCEESDAVTIRAWSEIRRIYDKEKQIAIMFLEEVDQESLYIFS
jgi:hypothetical protein